MSFQGKPTDLIAGLPYTCLYIITNFYIFGSAGEKKYSQPPKKVAQN